MGLELEMASEQLGLAADMDDVPLLRMKKEMNGFTDATPAGYHNSHPRASVAAEREREREVEVEEQADAEAEELDSSGKKEDKAPLLMKGHVPSHVTSSSSNGLEEQQLHHAANGTLAESDSLEEMEVKYAAYVRKDAYGTWGAGPVTIWEAVKLFLAVLVIVPIRVVSLLFVLALFYVICRVCTLFRTPSQQDGLDGYAHLTGLRRSIIFNSGRFCARLILFILGFYSISVTERDTELMERLQLGLGEPGENHEEDDNASVRAGAIVSNHISYLDILYHMSASFPSFVAKSAGFLTVVATCPFAMVMLFGANLKRSVARIPLVGLISKCLGCVYVQRESKSTDFKGVSGVVVQRLQAATQHEEAPSLLLFPEGTTTNGDYLLPFKTGAFLAGTPVLPVILRYPYVRFSPAWDTISGVRHVCLLLCQFVNNLEVTRLPLYRPSAKECEDPKLYAQNVRRLMAAEGSLTMSDIGLPEKRIYHSALREMRCGSSS